ncbi:MAG: GtrA family protein [Candidatus Parcubacteria bacterium]|nr:GtrA family protein [Candidatus Parcubacteria bacterium]
MDKKDIIYSLIVGEAIALMGTVILKNLEIGNSLPLWLLPVFFPILSVAGIWIADLLGKKIPVLFQAAKFLLVGVLNTLIDLGVLNILIGITGIAAGAFFPVFKGASFIVASLNSYFWNKFWTFKKVEENANPKEFTKFFLTVFIGLILNVVISSVIVNVIGVRFGVSEKVWANFGALIATLIAFAWNFFGSKFLVFKK